VTKVSDIDFYERECFQIYLDYFQFDFDNLPLIKDEVAEKEEGIEAYTFVFYDVLFVYDKTSNDKMIWSLNENDLPKNLLWLNGKWDNLKNNKKEAIITLYNLCVKDKEVVKKLSKFSPEELLHILEASMLEKKKKKKKKSLFLKLLRVFKDAYKELKN